jgi:molybdopterin converting factor small subunit
MAVVTVRFFGPAAEAAGCRSLSVDADDVARALEEVLARCGPNVAAVLERSALWRNGEPADRATPLASGDELAVLPPVSGG